MILLVFLMFEFSIINVHCSSPPIRQTSNGPVEGIEETSILGQKYYAFRSIPFAEPPITGTDPNTGERVDRRFKAPEPLKYTWTKTLKAHNFTDSCMPVKVNNKNSLNQTFSENCLFLNVYVPVSTTEKKTVMVFIAGGGFAGHDVDGQYMQPDFLLSEDNVVVTFSYRLGIFGFLNLDYGEYTGNMGLKDQQMALKWVFENIENFGGKKEEILLFGQSKGAACVHLQMLNEQSRKYFNRAFSMSGSAFYSYPLSLIDGNNVESMKNCTKINEINKLAEHLARTSVRNVSEYNSNNTRIWAPTIEGPNATNAFLVKSPEEIYNSSKAPVMDTMFSFNFREGIASFKDLLNRTEPLIEADLSSTEMPFFLDGFTKENFPKEYDQAMRLLRDEYYAHSISPEAMPYQNYALISDLGLVWGILKAAMYQANANSGDFTGKDDTKNTFLFRFSVHTNLSVLEVTSNLSYIGATHADDLCFVFPCHQIGSKMYMDDFKDNALNLQIVKRSVKMITNFARTGDPSIEDRTPFKSCKSSAEIFCTDITNDPVSQIMTDIKQQLHFDTWFEVMNIYEIAKLTKSGSKCHKMVYANVSMFGLIFINWLWYQIHS